MCPNIGVQMSIDFQHVKKVIKAQVPTIAGVGVQNMGVAYNVDPSLAGNARFFKKLAGTVNLLAPNVTYICDQPTPASRNGVIFKDFQPEVGDILQFGLVQYLVERQEDGDEYPITYLQPALQEATVEGSIFRRVAVPIQVVAQITARSMDVISKWPLVAGDTLQIGQKRYRIEVINANPSSDRWDVGFTTEITDFNYDEGQCFLICNPAYISEAVTVGGKIGPFDLVFPIATQFKQDFDMTVLVELMSFDKVIKSYTQTTKSTAAMRFPLWEVPVSHSSLVCAERILGRMDYNGGAVGLSHGCILQWEDTFPSDQIDRWTIRYKINRPGRLVVRMDPNPPQVLEITTRGEGSLSIDGFNKLQHPVKRVQFAYTCTASNPSESDVIWIKDITPDNNLTRIRYTVLFESTLLYRSDHLLMSGPKAQPSLPDISLCTAEPDKLDAGFLLRKE